MIGNLAQNFGRIDYLMALPIMLLTLFALGILLIDLMLPAEWKWVNRGDRPGRHSVFRRRSGARFRLALHAGRSSPENRPS